jgi:hypothetical protein
MPISINEFYRLNNYDPGGGYGKVSSAISQSVGSQTAGRENVKYIYGIEEDEDVNEDEHEDVDEDEYEEIDDYVSRIVSKKISGHKPVADLGNRKDNATLTNNNHMSIFEYAGNHKNYITKGLSPRLTYRSVSNTKGPSIGTQSSATYIRNRPGRKSGTQYGTSRKHKILTDIEDDNIFNLQDLLDPIEISFIRHNNKTKKILAIIKEYLIIDKT